MTVLLVTIAGLALVDGLASLFMAFLVTVPDTYELQAWIVGSAQPMIALAWILRLATFVPFGMFLYRCNLDARAVGHRPLSFSPGAMVWWFLVPIANLFMPRRAMLEVWKSTALQGESDPNHGRAVINWWWLFWLADLYANRLAVALFGGGAGLVAYNAGIGVASLVTMMSALTALHLVRSVDRRIQTCAAEGDSAVPVEAEFSTSSMPDSEQG